VDGDSIWDPSQLQREAAGPLRVPPKHLKRVGSPPRSLGSPSNHAINPM